MASKNQGKTKKHQNRHRKDKEHQKKDGNSKKSICIDSRKLHHVDEYVCWIDTMGVSNRMADSFERAANFIFRFHVRVLDAINKITDDKHKVYCYPIMDGVYISCENINTIIKVLEEIYNSLSQIFLNESDAEKLFLIRGAIARGQVAHGDSITDDVCPELANAMSYKQMLMIGMPMIQAYSSERMAPPFGLYIHESARSIEHLKGCYYMFNYENENALRAKIDKYFEWCKMFYNCFGMTEEKIKKYQQLNKENLSQRYGNLDSIVNTPPPVAYSIRNNGTSNNSGEYSYHDKYTLQ